MVVKITKEEQKAIAALKRLAKKWPESIGLFSWSGSLVVTKEVDGLLAVIGRVQGITNDGGDPNINQEVHDPNEIEIEEE